jgi:Kef-type K+ transport system membrane component KefB
VGSLGVACVLGAVVLTAGRLWIARVPAERYARGLPAADLAAVLAATLLLAAASKALGVSSIFGGFLAGVAISFNPAMAKALDQRLHDFVAVFFLPIFFMLTGLRADVRGMGGDPALWGLLLLLLGVACAGKIVPCALAARISGMDARESLAVGLLMNTRGMMALVVIHLGYELGVFPPPLFFMLVAMTLLTTLLTTPLARRLVPAAVGLEKAA